MGGLARGEVGEGLERCDRSYEFVQRAHAHVCCVALGRLALTGAALDQHRFGVGLEPVVQINTAASERGNTAKLIPVASGGRYARVLSNRPDLNRDDWGLTFHGAQELSGEGAERVAKTEADRWCGQCGHGVSPAV
ncbi:hypothetical protein EMIT047CA2_80052 [Pseudomonas soli]